MAIWIMEDEELELEMLELFKEARQRIDETTPRGDKQTEWLWSRIQADPEQIRKWFTAHYVMHQLERELEYGD